MKQHSLSPRDAEVLRRLREEMTACLTGNILPFWLTHMQDHERGGWYGRMTGRGQVEKDAPRGAILYARLLWTFSAAYRVLRGSSASAQYLQAATMTKDYILEHFIDREHGGTYWSITADGQPLDTKKQFYAIGFMIYGFSEYARATADSDAAHRQAGTEALATALQLFEVIEHHAWDREHGGYIEACTRDWQPIADMRLSDKDENYPKSQNTHLHIIEPYTNLLRTIHNSQFIIHNSQFIIHNEADAQTIEPEVIMNFELCIMNSVRSLLSLFTDHILNPATHHLDLFFAMDWTRMSTAESYGHDIECSWLMHEAAMVLADARVIKEVEPVVREVATASEKGLLSSGAMIHESGDADLHWWVQAEAVVGFFNLYQHFGDEAALTKALGVWSFIQEHLIDYENGEWYWSVREDGRVNLDDDHAGFWKCPYHNGRMCLELIERIGSMLVS